MIEKRTMSLVDYNLKNALSEIPDGLFCEIESPADRFLRPFFNCDADDIEIKSWLSDAAEDEVTKSHVKLAIRTLQREKGLSEKQQKLLDRLTQGIQEIEEVDLLNGDLTLFEKNYYLALFRIIKRSKMAAIFARISN